MEIMLHVIQRRVAKMLGMPRYFTGNPCPKGHVCEKQTCNKKCVQCRRDFQNAQHAKPSCKARRAAYDRQRWETDRASLESKNRRYYEENSEAVNAQKRSYWSANKERMAAARDAWRQANPNVVRHHNAARKSHIKRATPPWADMALIAVIYAEAERLTLATGVLHHVDHEIPLGGVLVCGLHVQNNLRPLPWQENISKKNKFTPELS